MINCNIHIFVHLKNDCYLSRKIAFLNELGSNDVSDPASDISKIVRF